ncbi:MAG: hypothetical protein HFK00_05375 [Oscillospiraceae bacterium]|nr:hypothetical protein [Oscillospiraceae bacterium]
MKRFLKKVNRGLVLAGLILIGFVIYIIFDMNSFKKNKPQIAQTLKEYISEIEDVAVTPENLQNIDFKISASDKNEREIAVNELMSKYWTYEKGQQRMFYGMTRDDYKSMIMSQFNDDNHENNGNGYITKWSAHTENVNISKAGPGYATVSLNCQIVAEFAGNPFFINPGYIMPVLDFSDNAVVFSEHLSKITYNGSYVFIMKKVGDKWKIAYTDWNGWNSNVTSLNSEGGTEE